MEKNSINHELLVAVHHTHTSMMTARGAEKVSNVSPVTEHVIGLA